MVEIGTQKVETAKKVRQLMAYIYMPLIFTVIGLGLLYLAAAPYMDRVINIVSAVTVQKEPSFYTRLDSIYEEPVMDIEEQTDTISEQDIVWPKYGEQYGRITCSRIRLDTPIYFGDHDDILKEGAGQYIGTFLPGYNRLILLTGHNTSWFKPLQDVRQGDVFTFSTSYGIYQYEVIETKITDDKDDQAYDLLMEEEMLVMYTGYPFDTLAGSKTDHFFVYAKKIAGPVVTE